MKNILSVLLVVLILFSSFSYASPVPAIEPYVSQNQGIDTVTGLIKNGLDLKNDLLKGVVDTVGELVKKAITKFSDVANHWGKEFIAVLTEVGIFGGYPDGTFKPDNNITVAEFTKIIVVSSGASVSGNIEGGQWYLPFVSKAMELNIIQSGEFKDSEWNRPINRGEMARMVVRALVLKGEIYPSNIDEYKVLIKDFSLIPYHLRDDVLNAYSIGIISGYPDGTYKADRNATRAEASVMINRMLDKSIRAKVEVPKVDKSFPEPVFDSKSMEGYGLYIHHLYLVNYKDFEDFEYKVNNLSHPEFDVRVFGGSMPGTQIYDKFEELKGASTGSKGAALYGMPDGKDPELVSPKITLEKGTLIKFKITLRKNNVEKIYYHSFKL